MAKIYRVIQIKLNQFKKKYRRTNKAYLSAINVTNISRSFYLQDGGKNQLAQTWNKITSLPPYA